MKKWLSQLDIQHVRRFRPHDLREFAKRAISKNVSLGSARASDATSSKPPPHRGGFSVFGMELRIFRRGRPSVHARGNFLNRSTHDTYLFTETKPPLDIHEIRYGIRSLLAAHVDLSGRLQ
ncbi:MAG: hypothetical protein MUF13_14145, partial [Akkermansiaceae bacterium]|nr:hypothetical protein [Akkermansiaceae bacterium]